MKKLIQVLFLILLSYSSNIQFIFHINSSFHQNLII